MNRNILFLSLLIVFCMGNTDLLAQCAMCRASVESNLSETGGGIGAGLNTGILYLMAIPYILLSVIGVLWYRASKASKRSKVQSLA